MHNGLDKKYKPPLLNRGLWIQFAGFFITTMIIGALLMPNQATTELQPAYVDGDKPAIAAPLPRDIWLWEMYVFYDTERYFHCVEGNRDFGNELLFEPLEPCTWLSFRGFISRFQYFIERFRFPEHRMV